MSKTVDTKEYLDLVVSLLHSGKTNVPVTVSGVSMTPFLHNGDIVYLNLPDRPWQVGDVVLFTRPNGSYILHRIVKLEEDHCQMLGDSQLTREYIDKNQIHALVTSVRIGNRVMKMNHPYCLFYRTVWRWLAPFRPQIGKLHRLLKRQKVAE